MYCFQDDSPSSVIENLVQLDNYGYEGVLFTYYGTLEYDYWITCAYALAKTKNLEYIIAIRPYAISVEYFIKMFNSSQAINKDKISFNIVPGNVEQREFFQLDNLIGIKNLVDTRSKRFIYAEEWLGKLKNNNNLKSSPKLYMTGEAPDALELSKKFTDAHFCSSIETVKFLKKDRPNCKAIVPRSLLVRDTYEEAEKLYNLLELQHEKLNCIWGDPETVKKKIKDLEDLGVDALLVRPVESDENVKYMHKFVSSMKRGII